DLRLAVPRVDAHREHGAEDAADHVREALAREAAVRVGLLQRLRELLSAPQLRVKLNAALLVEALERELPARGGAPVGHHPAGIPEGALEDLLEEDTGPAGVVAVDLVVGAHDRAGLRALDGDLEGE